MISIESVRKYCLQKGELIFEDFPFDETTLVIKVAGKAFVLADITRDVPALNLKCDPDLALELRARYDTVLPGYHMNKKHWNTVILDGSVPDGEILAMIDHSFERVVAGLGKSVRRKLDGNKQKRRKPAQRGLSRTGKP